MNDWGDDFDEAKAFSKPAGVPFSEEFYLRMDAEIKRLGRQLNEALAKERAEVDRLLAGYEGAFRDSSDHVQETTMRAVRAAHRQRYAKLDLPITPQPITPRTHHG